MIEHSNDLNDQLQSLNDHLRVGTNAHAVYIGRMVKPKRLIDEADNDRAHLNAEAES